MTLVEFLLERIAEDEAVARSAHAGTWRFRNDFEYPDLGNISSDDEDGETQYAIAHDNDREAGYGAVDVENASHIVRWQPRRVLAECDAKRRIIELHQRHEDDAQFDRWNHAEKRMEWRRGAACQECGHIDENPIEWPCPTLRLLSLPFRDHPSYRPEWAPESDR